MEKNVSKFILSLMMFVSVFLIFTPYFTSNFLDLRQKKEDRENYIKYLKEEAKIYLTGKFDPATREDFVLIPPEYIVGINKMYLRKETYEAYLKMKSAANLAEIELRIASATRNFDYQKDFWNKRWTGYTLVEEKDLSKSIPLGLDRFKKILEYSATPGTSRHHWGTEIDINDGNISYFNGEEGKKVYDWLNKNASLFGFCQTYNQKGVNSRVNGHEEEKWHWSYLPLAQTFTIEYKNLVKNEDIKGFLGDEYAPELNLIENYVLSINPDCI